MKQKKHITEIKPKNQLIAHLPEQAKEGQFSDAGQERAAPPERGCPATEVVPRLVIRGERYTLNNSELDESLDIQAFGNSGKYRVIRKPLPKEDAEPQAALTDYLNTTFQFSPSQETILELLGYFKLFLGEAFGELEKRNGGLHGYKVSYTVGETSAMFAYGGQRGTAFFSMPGSTCALIKDWESCYHLFHEILNAKITRWDGAVDVFDGIPSVNDAVNFYKSDLFNAGGNRPSCSQHGNWIEPDGSGRTFYVGKRKNGKLLRVYEKGKQLGDPDSAWVRWELELHSRDRVIPWDVILEPGKYVAAAYPCMAWVNEIQERIKTIKKANKISYEHLTYYAQQAYGSLINVMLKVEGSPEKVIERLKRSGIPSRLELADQSIETIFSIDSEEKQK
ncbi:MAG: replication initiation factor domain-containing protein [Methylococcaceae bacterium]|nr:replication initiation factor domain-containing protein [Methylococcaceae bacterium]